MKVRDLMATTVVTTHPDSTLKSAAAEMVRNGVSGMPVVDAEGKIVGMITEADFVATEAQKDMERGRRLLDALYVTAEPVPGDELVRNAMATPPILVPDHVNLSSAARIMHERGVKRLPVVDEEGKLVGIISRADIVRAFVRPDELIVDEIIEDILRRLLLIDPDAIDVTVDGGVVSLGGRLPTKSDVRLLSELTERLDGVIRVESSVEWDTDDTRPETPKLH